MSKIKYTHLATVAHQLELHALCHRWTGTTFRRVVHWQYSDRITPSYQYVKWFLKPVFRNCKNKKCTKNIFEIILCSRHFVLETILCSKTFYVQKQFVFENIMCSKNWLPVRLYWSSLILRPSIGNVTSVTSLVRLPVPDLKRLRWSISTVGDLEIMSCLRIGRFSSHWSHVGWSSPVRSSLRWYSSMHSYNEPDLFIGKEMSQNGSQVWTRYLII